MLAKTIDRPVLQVATKLPKITVVGMLPIQQQKLLEQLQGLADFNFVDKNRRSKVIPDGQDYVILMGSFISHAIFAQAKKVNCGKLIVHYGGIGKLAIKMAKML